MKLWRPSLLAATVLLLVAPRVAAAAPAPTAAPAPSVPPELQPWIDWVKGVELPPGECREVDEETIFQTIAAQRALVDHAARETLQTRRLRARRAHLQAKPALPLSAPADEPVIALPHFPVEVWE